MGTGKLVAIPSVGVGPAPVSFRDAFQKFFSGNIDVKNYHETFRRI